MKCNVCGRELNPDSKFCDWCGARIQNEQPENGQVSFNYRALLTGILISIIISLLVSAIFPAIGIPLFFGGLFLPFFWNKKR